jgi:Peptidase family M1 domain
MKQLFFVCLISLSLLSATAQPDRWQQRVKYSMDIKMDVNANQLTGKQKLEYTNNSPDTLYKVFYHLYWNAFQPNSMMDARSRELGNTKINGRPDWDGRVRDRISKLKPAETGYQKIISLKMDGIAQRWLMHETILEVVLTKPILPRSKVVLDMEFETQVPVQIRRSGRDNAEGVRFSMSQWYPKLCEYDYDGWHPNPYVAREFYGVWGDFDVNITIDKNYIIGGTGYLQNPQEIGYGYEAPKSKVTRSSGNTLTWKFTAPNVHDFVWAADPGYKHISTNVANGPVLHVFYKSTTPAADSSWMHILWATERVLPFIEKNFGKYPYKQYSFIQGGDGGMEYPMATLLKGSGLGTVFHEWMHTWYQMILGTDESQYAWMDEGFTSYAESLVTLYYYEQIAAQSPFIKNKEGIRRAAAGLRNELPVAHADAYASYMGLAKSGIEEPLTTHADHFNTNAAYSTAAYSKGEVFLEQLGYIIGAGNRDKTLLEYYRLWRFKHPNAADFIRVAEKVSGLQLDWYKQYFVNGTKTPDYAIDSLWEEGGKSNIRLRRIGLMPMPLDVLLTFKDGSKEMHYVPMSLMYGEKPAEDNTPRISYEGWRWTHPTFIIQSNRRLLDLQVAEIDPSQRMVDMNRRNNRLEPKW